MAITNKAVTTKHVHEIKKKKKKVVKFYKASATRANS